MIPPSGDSPAVIVRLEGFIVNKPKGQYANSKGLVRQETLVGLGAATRRDCPPGLGVSTKVIVGDDGGGSESPYLARNLCQYDVSTVDGRGGRTRTCDLRFWRPLLYQLSYAPAY